MVLQLLADQLCAKGAHADQPDAAISQGFDDRHSDICIRAIRAHLFFGKGKQDYAAHALAPRFAAASASRAWE